MCIAGCVREGSQPQEQIQQLAADYLALTAGITCSVHFTILSVSRQIVAGLPAAALLFSFRWPSVAYALDIWRGMDSLP